MPVHTIASNPLSSNPPVHDQRIRDWCSNLEAGGILYFPHTPVPIPQSDLEFLLGRQQTSSSLPIVTNSAA
jgi:hypothetical protein